MPKNEPRENATTDGDAGSGRRFNFNLSKEAYDALHTLGREQQRSMTEIVRLALSLIRIALEEVQNGNKLVICRPDGTVLRRSCCHAENRANRNCRDWRKDWNEDGGSTVVDGCWRTATSRGPVPVRAEE
jgi:hypothetical protein